MTDFTQSELFESDDSWSPITVYRPQNALEAHQAPNLSDYDRFVVFMSGGKDSIATVLHLLDCGVAKERIELHHHDVDGREGSTLMDWPITADYCRAFAEVMEMRLYFSWKVGGIESEMLRENSRTAPIRWESADGTVRQAGGDGGKLGTRRKFPQVGASLMTRWCSAYVKVDVGARLITGEERFREGKTLVVTGERAEESSARAKYKSFEPHRTDNRDGARVSRWVDHWRPIHAWSEQAVWDIMQKYLINPHPSYHLGWGRTSCLSCIFGSPNQWASVRQISPETFESIAEYEADFGTTIHRTLTVRQRADKGVAYKMDPAMVSLATGRSYPNAMVLVPEGAWKLPAGAFGESSGPT